jgi:hypothetical protein
MSHDLCRVTGPSWEGPVFIVGMPRSGTKLLRSIVSRHPRICIPAIETEFLPFIFSWVAKHGPVNSPQAFTTFARALGSASYFSYRDPSQPPFLPEAWYKACAGRFDAAGLFEGFIRLETQAARGSGLIWGDKSPTYIRYLPAILQQFPSAKVLHIVRDVRDYCMSMYQAWRKDMLRAAQRWSVDVSEAQRVCTMHPDRCLSLKYENLLETPELVIKEVCQFLQLEYFAQMLVMTAPTENHGEARGRTEIVSNNRGKYRKHLTSRRLGALEALAFDGMRIAGYTPEIATSPKRLGTVSLAIRKICDGIRMVTHDVEQRGLLASYRFYANHRRVSKN